MRIRKYWGWGYVDEGLSSAEEANLAVLIETFFGSKPGASPPPPSLEAYGLAAPRLARPENAGFAWSESAYDRVLHACGRSTRDLIRLRRGQVDHAPDLVLYPASVDQLVDALDWADRANAAVIPFGGGTSVTGGVEPDVPARFSGAVSLDLSRLNKVLEIDPVSQMVHTEAGILAPDLDAVLKPHGLGLRHYPQSYYFSTVGGWVATRAGGHYSTLAQKIDSRVASLEVCSATGQIGQTRRLPQSSVGPDPNMLWIGSEGLLGVLTKAWLRAVPLPKFKKSTAVTFPSFQQALTAARAIVQSGLAPAHLRVLDPFEAMISQAFASGALRNTKPLMVLGFESPEHPVDDLLALGLKLAESHGGAAAPPSKGSEDVDTWRNTFFRQPYLRDVLIGWGVVAETFETAIPWDRAESFYEQVREATLEAVEQNCGAGAVLCRSTHAYPDGVALYFTFLGAGRPGAELEQWTAIKTAATDAVIAGGGTASHHHACGRDHAPWTKQELPGVWKTAFLGAKSALDPAGRLNPGVLFPAT